MAISPVTPPGGPGDCTSCTDTKSLLISFTNASPTPANGYIVKWKRASDSTYTTVSPNPTSSPVSVSNVPACEDVDVIVQSSCGPGQLSTEQTTVATGGGYFLRCGCSFQGSIGQVEFYQYPNISLFFGGVTNGTTITLNYNAQGRPNRFEIYNVITNSVVATSGWVGTGGYTGPWSPGSPGTANGTLTFTFDISGSYFLRVAAGPANPSTEESDSWEVSLNCATTPPPPTYYYYTGILCGGSIQQTFRSTLSNLAGSTTVVRILCAACGNTEQCFDTITGGASTNTNDVIATYADCETCNGTTTHVAISTIYTPCSIVSTNSLTASDIYIDSELTDIAPGVQLYNSSINNITTVSLIASSTGTIYNVNNSGLVGTATGNAC